jgi:colanic acid biosynthesis glycosyl transferase WcaI
VRVYRDHWHGPWARSGARCGGSVCAGGGEHGIVFWIVGDGAHREKLAREAVRRKLTNVIFTGRLPRDRMPAIISACDACLVHLRGAELFGSVIPSKIFELMAMETPIIMGVRGQALDFVLDAGAGVTMEPDSAASLIAGIREIKRRGRAAFSGRAYVMEKFNRDALANRMLEILVAVTRGVR